MEPMRKTPLNEWHRSHGATMTDFNGWDMPLYYRGITEEHLHTRQAAGLFDLSHMGRIWITGSGAREYVDGMTPARVKDAKAGDVQYSFLLDERGHTIDDITVYYDDVDVLLVVNAGNKDRDYEWLKSHEGDVADVTVTDFSDRWGMIALQGPRSNDVMRALFGGEFAAPGYYRFAKLTDTIFPGDMIVSETGYTGEQGYEFYLPAEHVAKLWEALMAAAPEADVAPIGLGARDSLRLEAGMPLYGHELNDETTPLCAGLGKFCDLEKPSFIGRDALIETKNAGGPSKKLVGFEMTQRGPVARQGFDICSADGAVVGKVASGIFSPSLQKVVGMAYVDTPLAKVGNEVLIDIRGRKLPANIVKRPFYKRSA